MDIKDPRKIQHGAIIIEREIQFRVEPCLLKNLLLEAEIVGDDFRADELLKAGQVILERTSAHPGMTVRLHPDQPIQLCVGEIRYKLTPKSTP